MSTVAGMMLRLRSVVLDALLSGYQARVAHFSVVEILEKYSFLFIVTESA